MDRAIKHIVERLEFAPMEVADEMWKRPYYCSYSPFQHIPQGEKDEIIALTASDSHLDRAVGCIVGMAVGDAVGQPLEFLPIVDTPGSSDHSFNLDDMTYTDPLDRFHLLPGQWTDDTAMGLCIADSLIALRKYDGSDIRLRFWNWWFNGYNNAFRNDQTRSNSVGLGDNIAKSIDVLILKPGEIPPARYEADTEDAGIGSLMRLAAVPIFYHNDIKAAMHYAAESSFTTHPGPVAAEACSFLSYAIVRAIEKGGREAVDARQFLDTIASDYLALLKERTRPGTNEIKALLESSQPADGLERCWNWKSKHLDIAGTLHRRGDRYNNHRVFADYFGAYCMDGLAIALHSVYHTTSFDRTIERCVNFLGDADSTAAVAGQLAGAIYGYSTIHGTFVENLNKWDDREIALRGVLLNALGSGKP